MKSIFWIALIVITGQGIGFAQESFSLYNMNNIAQSQYVNPAFRPSSKVGVSFSPFSNFVSFNVLHSGFALDDILQSRQNSDSLDLTIENALSKMAEVNYFDLDLRNEFFALNITGRRTGFNFTVNHILHSSFSYPKGLVELLYYGNGNAETIGRRLSFDNLGYNLSSYFEFAFGLNQRIGNRLVIGGKFKYLVGTASVETETSHFGLTTDAKTFDLTVDGQARINTANSAGFFEDSGPNVSSVFSALSGVKNNGIAIDLGFTYDLTQKIHLSGSILDLGSIKWQESVENYTIEPFEFEYNGIDLVRYLEDSNKVFDEIIDSLETLTDIKTTNNSYRTALNSRFYLSGSYDVVKMLNLGLTWFNSFRSSQYRTSVNVSANLKLKHWVTMTGNYSIYNYGNSNFGLGVSLRLGAFQVYGMSNSMIALFRPESTRRLDFNLGMSFQIGKTPEYKGNLIE